MHPHSLVCGHKVLLDSEVLHYMLAVNTPCFVLSPQLTHNPSKVNHTVMLLAGISGGSKLDQQMDEALALLKSKPASKPRSISNFESAEADSILFELNFLQEDGNLACPIVVPAGSPSCCPFDYSQHPSEDAGTPALLTHLSFICISLGCTLAGVGFKCMMHTAEGRICK